MFARCSRFLFLLALASSTLEDDSFNADNAVTIDQLYASEHVSAISHDLIDPQIIRSAPAAAAFAERSAYTLKLTPSGAPIPLTPTQGLLGPHTLHVRRKRDGLGGHHLGFMAAETTPCHFHYIGDDVTLAVSDCGGKMAGTLIRNNTMHVIRPLKNETEKHVIYKREMSDDPMLKKFCGLNKTDSSISLAVRRGDVPTSRYSKSSDLTVEIAVFIDSKLYSKYSARPGGANAELERFVSTAFNNIGILYKQPSLRPHVQFKIVRYEVFTSQPYELSDSATRNGNAQSYLDAFCAYQKRLNGNWDHSFLFTGHNLHRSGDTSISGIAKLNGMCTNWGSCTVTEGLDFSAVFIGAHELGHSLGMNHDEPWCPSNHIMSSSLGAGKITWSTCSYNALSDFIGDLDRGRNCLRTEEGYEAIRIGSALPGQTWNADAQCELMHGSGYEQVIPKNLPGDSVCGMMWCRLRNYGRIITSHPALEGTHCGSGRWCRAGRCVTSGGGNNSPSSPTPAPSATPISGGWSSWGRVSCSSCACSPIRGGISVATTARTCSNPYPRNGGSCGDNSVRAAVCKFDCGSTDSLQNFMDRKCHDQRSRRGDWELSGKGSQLTKQDNQMRACKVFCNVDSSTKGRTYRFLGDFLPDGTPCGDAGQTKYCVDGQCLALNCNRQALIPPSSSCLPSTEQCDSRSNNGNGRGSWSTWSSWSSCSRTCGSGTMTRSRSCSSGSCSGSNSDSESCNTHTCPTSSTNNGWMTWEAWGICSVTCGTGNRQRYRQCRGSTSDCWGSRSETEQCDKGFCPWGSWTSCTVTCGGGRRSRYRDCPGSRCSGKGTEDESCGTGSCVGKFNPWQSWQSCSKQCNVGEQLRYRTCQTSTCVGETSQRRSCNTHVCRPGSETGSYSDWSEWSRCSVSCGTGTRSRSRACGSSYCSGALTESSSCNLFSCSTKVDWAQWGSWGAWTSCSVTCATGSQKRYRNCDYSTGDRCIGDEIEQARPCHESPCAKWTQWSVWSTCSRRCGHGERVKSRSCDGIACSGHKEEVEACNTHVCGTRRRKPTRFDAYIDQPETRLSTWSEWSICSVTCGGGTQRRQRSCTGSNCDGETEEDGVCNTEPCSDVGWGGWGDWSDCTESCGGGTQKRMRNCYDDVDCVGVSLQSRECNSHVCKRSLRGNVWLQWSPWSSCSNGCKRDSVRIRGRKCGSPDGCVGVSLEREACESADPLHCPETR